MHRDNSSYISKLAIITALCLLGDSMLYIVLPLYYTQVGLNALWEVGVILAVNRFVRLPLNPVIGWLYGHISERTGILIAVVLAVLTTFSYGFLPGLAWWIIARCLWGMAWTLLRLGSLFSILRISTPQNRGFLTGRYNGLYRLGSLAGMLSGGLLVDLIGFQYTVSLFALITAGAIILVYLYIPKASKTPSVAKQSSLIAVLATTVKNSKILWIMMTGGMVAFVIQGIIASTLSRLIDAHLYDEFAVWGMVVGAATLAGFFQALRWAWEPWLAPMFGRLSDGRFSRASVLSAAFGIGGVCMALLAVNLPLLIWFCCLLIVQLVATALTTVSEATATDAASEQGGRALVMSFALIVDIGAAIGPLVAFTMDSLWGINSVYVLCAGLFAVFCFKWRRLTPHASE